MRTRLGVLVLLLGLFGPVASALADDASLNAAAISRDAQLTKNEKRERSTQIAMLDDEFHHIGPYVRALRRVRFEERIVARRVRAEQPSSAGGAKFKSLVLRSTAARIHASEVFGDWARVGKQGRKHRASQLVRRGNRLVEHAQRMEHAANQALQPG